MKSEEIKSKTLTAMGWSFLEAVGMRGVQFVIGIILARLLLPSEFGLIGMLLIFMAVSQTFLDSGFGAALIQKSNPNQIDICSIFYFNIAMGLAVVGGLYIAAPWIADFYNQPILKPITRSLSLVIVINSFGLIQISILQKELQFKTLTLATVAGNIVSGAVGVFLAFQGYGVWSLAVQQISNSFFQISLLWILNNWRPSLLFSFSSLREMFGFGSKLLISGLLNTVFDNIYFMIVGKLFPPAELGYYTRANNFQQLPSKTLSSMVGKVTFPVFSKIQNNQDQLKRGLKKSLTTLALINFPVMIGLSVVARPLVIVLLTEKWEPCVPYLQLLCVVGMMFPLHLINLNSLQAIGRSDLFLRLEIIKKVLIVAAILITWKFGIEALIIGQIVVSIISYYLNSYYNGVLIKYSIMEQLKDILPVLFATLGMAAFVHGVSMLPLKNYLVLLIVQVILGIIIYVGLCHVLKLPAFLEMRIIVLKKFNFIKEETN